MGAPESEEVVATIKSAAFGLQALGACVEPSNEVFPEWSTMLALGTAGFPPASGAPYERAQDTRAQWWSGFQGILKDRDLLLTPTIQHVAFTVERWHQAWSDGLAEFSMQWCAHTFPHNFLGGRPSRSHAGSSMGSPSDCSSPDDQIARRSCTGLQTQCSGFARWGNRRPDLPL